MKISGKTVTFDNGILFGLGETYSEIFDRLDGTAIFTRKNEFISYDCDDLIKNYPCDIGLYFFNGGEIKDGITEIEITFRSVNKFDKYDEFVESRLKMIKELKEYLLDQFPNAELVGSGEDFVTIIVDDLAVAVSTPREYTSLNMYILPKEALEEEN